MTSSPLPGGGAERRQFVRVQYPAFERPVFRAPSWEATILDVSQGGMRATVSRWPTDNTVIATGATLDGALELEAEEPVPVHGKVLRFDGETFAFQFLEPLLPPGLIERQQRLLHARHPHGY